MKRTKINLLFLFTLAIAVSCALWEIRASADRQSPVTHNGPARAGISASKARNGTLNSNVAVWGVSVKVERCSYASHEQ